MDIELSLDKLCSIYQVHKPLLIVNDGNRCYYYRASITLGKHYWWLREGCCMEDMLLHEFTHYLLALTPNYIFDGHNDVFFNKLKEVIKKFRGDESNYPWPIEYKSGQEHAAKNNTYPGLIPSVSVGLRELIGQPYSNKGRRER